MRRVGVVLLTVGAVVFVVGLFPGLVVEGHDAKVFGPQQTIAVVAGGVLMVVGLLMAGRKKRAASAPEAPAEEPAEVPAEAPAEEPVEAAEEEEEKKEE